MSDKELQEKISELEEINRLQKEIIFNLIHINKNFLSENKELKEENKKMEELIENSECDMSTNYIRKSKVEELKEQYKNKLDIQDNKKYTFKEVVQTWINICDTLLGKE